MDSEVSGPWEHERTLFLSNAVDTPGPEAIRLPLAVIINVLTGVLPWKVEYEGYKCTAAIDCLAANGAEGAF